MLKYAGVPLTIPSPQQAAWIEAKISTNDIFDFERRLYPGNGLSGVGFGGKIRARPVVPNTLYWPTGASNFAVGYFFCSGSQKTLITQAVYGGSPTLIPIPPAPTLATVGGVGTTDYSYAIASFGLTGDSSGPSTAATISTGFSPLDTNNYVSISWTAVPNAWGYRVLKWNGVSFALLATVGANLTSFHDIGLPTTPYASPTSYRFSPQPLELSQYDQSGTLKNFVLTNMYLLPPRPLSQIFNEVGDQLYLMTLVDERYFWWEKSTFDMLFPIGSSWDDVWNWLSGCLGKTITVDAIPATYLTIDRALTAPYEYLALVIDAVSYMLGQKILRYFDGSVRSANVLPEETAEQVEIATLTPIPNMRAGGRLTIDPLIVPNDMNSLVPASVTFVFQTTVAGTETENIHVIEVFLNTLGLPEFSGIMGHAGSKVFKGRYLATFTADTESTPTNQTDLLAYCQQFATDWYRWRIGQLDAVWQGTPAGVIEGLTDDVEYTYAGDEVSCRVQRGTWMDLTDDLLEGKFQDIDTEGGGGPPAENICCPPATYHLLTDFDCTPQSGGQITAEEFHDFTFLMGLLQRFDGNSETVCLDFTSNLVDFISCDNGHMDRTILPFRWVNGKLYEVGGEARQCGDSFYTLYTSVVANSDGSMTVKHRDFSFTNGLLVAVSAEETTVFEDCADCSSGVVPTTCCPPSSFPATLYATLTSSLGDPCTCLAGLGSIQLVWDGVSKFVGGRFTTCGGGTTLWISFDLFCVTCVDCEVSETTPTICNNPVATLVFCGPPVFLVQSTFTSLLGNEITSCCGVSSGSSITITVTQ